MLLCKYYRQNKILISALTSKEFSYWKCNALFNRFVVDSADHEKLDAARQELRNLLDKPQLASIPVLVLGNKNDLEDALPVDKLIEEM